MYNFNETDELDSRVINNKIGYQACVWTERIPSEAVFEKFVFPRFQAFSEVAWSRGRDFNSFKKRLISHLSYMDEVEINYKKPDFMNQVKTKYINFSEMNISKSQCEKKHNVPLQEIICLIFKNIKAEIK